MERLPPYGDAGIVWIRPPLIELKIQRIDVVRAKLQLPSQLGFGRRPRLLGNFCISNESKV
jgi:hypothetical protein